MASSSTSKYPVLPSTKAPRVVRKRVGGGYKYVLEMTEGKDAHDKEKGLDKDMEKAYEEVRGEVSTFVLSVSLYKYHFASYNYDSLKLGALTGPTVAQLMAFFSPVCS